MIPFILCAIGGVILGVIVTLVVVCCFLKDFKVF